MSRAFKTVTSKGRSYHYFEGPILIRLSDDPLLATAEAAELQRVVDLLPDMMRQFGEMVRTAKKRAASIGVRFDLSAADLVSMFVIQRGRCAVSGIEFDMWDTDGNRFATRRPFRPSIDRVHNGKGYTTDNVRLVCVAVNLAMHEWGEATLLKIARAIVERADREQELENGQENAPVALGPVAA